MRDLQDAIKLFMGVAIPDWDPIEDVLVGDSVGNLIIAIAEANLNIGARIQTGDDRSREIAIAGMMNVTRAIIDADARHCVLVSRSQ